MNKKYEKYFAMLEEGIITEDEVFLRIFKDENKITEDEYEFWLTKLHDEYLKQFNKKHRVAISHYKAGLCSLDELLEAIELLEKYKKS